MNWLQSLDSSLFRLINQTLSNPLFDAVMPLLSGHRLFWPAVLLAAVGLAWRGGPRGRLCLLMLLIILPLGEAFVTNPLKQVIGRPRPFLVEEGVNLLLGRGRAPSMPSAHAANWFAVATIFYCYYRRSAWWLVPWAALVAFSRVYNGVHYPSDVLVGAIVGAGYAAAGVWTLNALWQSAVRRWFAHWWAHLPTLVPPPASGCQRAEADVASPPPPAPDSHWLRLGYLWITILLAGRLGYLASGTIELTEDEAYQWVWSKHPALSYFSKPPLIAYAQMLGTALWGDTAFGVRFFSPVLAAVLGVLLLRFFAREVSAQGGFWLIAALTATPLLAVGSVLLTVDPLSVLFWTAAMLAGWRAVQSPAAVRPWVWVGVWMALGCLSKYTNLLQWVCWAVFFALWKPARAHLRTAGPYLALAINLVGLLPVVIWNWQHGWITAEHVAGNAGLHKPWLPTLRHFFEFLGSEAMLLNPVFFGVVVWAAVGFWRHSPRDPLLRFFFSMGATLFLIYTAWTLYSRVLPNWIAPSVIPLFCLGAAYGHRRWQAGAPGVGRAFGVGLAFGLVVVGVMHNLDVFKEVVGQRLPPEMDPMRRARGWTETARIVGEARTQLERREGRSAFIIGNHYGLTSQIQFYLPEAKARVKHDPLVFHRTQSRPRNQYFFWPGYRDRKGHNAIFVREARGPKLVSDWWWRWLTGRGEWYAPMPDLPAAPLPPELLAEFESVTDLGVREVMVGKRVLRRLQLYACRNLL